MRRELLGHFPIVVSVAQTGGFAAAAARLGMSPSAVSHAVKTVEDGIGLTLFARSTRSVALTEAGETFMAAIGPALTAIEEAVDRMHAARGRVTGLLRLNVPRVALPIVVTPVLAELALRHPELTVEVTSDDGLVDIVAGGRPGRAGRPGGSPGASRRGCSISPGCVPLSPVPWRPRRP